MEKDGIILVVDDNHENLRIVSNFLKEEGYKIALALDGNSAFEVLDENRIDLILLDVMMPEIDGYEVCQIIKKNDKLKEIPVIFLTAKTNPEDIVRGFEAGGVDYLTKPFIRAELLLRVKTQLDLYLSRKKLQDTIKTRDKLYSIIAHDLRAPFASISMLVDLVTEDIVSGDSSDIKELMTHLGKITSETEALLNNLLVWTKLQSDVITLKPQKLAVSPVFADCLSLLEGSLRGKGISVESTINPELTAFFDEITMHTVFRNILSNSIKFTPEGGKILVNAELSDKNNLTVTIRDTGVGIPEPVLRKIFDHNEAYSSPGTKSERGSGLGLKLIKDLTEQNKGTIRVESEVGKGTLFTVFLPVDLP
ncbi:MAG: hybrid sensor histidine kinase/response regulator [Mangrovibacterium sp.]|nr:hybrid sensor histidine kinase/response regulator [Mangrovibacterium sp.]